jgi:hypothetical protein
MTKAYGQPPREMCCLGFGWLGNCGSGDGDGMVIGLIMEGGGVGEWEEERGIEG